MEESESQRHEEPWEGLPPWVPPHTHPSTSTIITTSLELQCWSTSRRRAGMRVHPVPVPALLPSHGSTVVTAGQQDLLHPPAASSPSHLALPLGKAFLSNSCFCYQRQSEEQDQALLLSSFWLCLQGRGCLQEWMLRGIGSSTATQSELSEGALQPLPSSANTQPEPAQH